MPDRQTLTSLRLWLLLPLLVATWNLWVPYSYWLDELCSVTAARAGWAALFSDHLLIDVHPPLYSVVLKLWVGILGDHESVVRLLSWLLAMLAVGVAWRHFLRVEGSVFAFRLAVLMAANTFFASHAQEARSYALLLFLSTWALIDLDNAIRQRRAMLSWRSCLGLLLLSLTHYFGLILVFWLLVSRALLARWQWRPLLCLFLLGLLCLIWPLTHVLAGNLLRLSGGSFWIVSSGPLDTLIHAQSFLPGMALLLSYPGLRWLALVSALVAAMLVLWSLWHQHRRDEHDALMAYSFGIVTAVVVSVLLIDLVSPISTGRNFVILVPFVAWLLSRLIGQWSSQFGRLLLAALVLAGTAQGGWVLWQNKQSELENYRRDAQIIAARVSHLHASGLAVRIMRYDEGACRGQPMVWREEVEAYYLQRLIPEVPVQWRSVCRLESLRLGDIVLVRHQADLSILGQASTQVREVLARDAQGRPALFLIYFRDKAGS